jgi:hypothetical protein
VEKWLPIAGFEGLYEISDQGRVRGVDRIDSQGRRWRGRVLKPNMTNGRTKYHAFLLYRGGKHTAVRRLAARLVLEAFVGPAPTEEHQAAHWDGSTTNNCLSNLRWATPKENAADMLRHDTRIVRVGEATGRGKHTRVDVERMRDLRVQGYTQRAIAKWIGASCSSVCWILTGRSWGHV